MTPLMRSPTVEEAFNIVQVGTVRAGPLMGLSGALGAFGLALGPLLDEIGLQPTTFDDAGNGVRLDKAVRLLALAMERTNCPHFGLLCGQSVRIEDLGIVGRVARNAGDVGSGLRGLILNLHLNGHAFIPVLTTTSDLAELVLRLVVDADGDTDPSIDLGMAIACMAVRTLCGPGWAPVEILLARRAPVSREPYSKFFGAPVQFGREHNAIVFPAAWLKQRVHGANPTKRRLLERELAVVAQRHRLPAATMARRALVSCLARGEVSVQAVAASVGLHPRTLNRRLAGESTSVFELLKEERYRIACDLLANTPLPISEVAATLLYSSIGNFTRAFHAWSGESPSDWRLNHSKPGSMARSSV
ncbi:AraC family transcriptional regulator [Reyranella sp.]|uniref:AraC family transcriptional regulator n=1 Tax=Reyranella sp. TaxID=1929291 RepID=UPI0012280BFC|nr:AraC family transcriptional regulator [Reyranella sp.]TAJ87634.1 MAG: AraC family transcriptional regulator [Reyranella sp.]